MMKVKSRLVAFAIASFMFSVVKAEEESDHLKLKAASTPHENALIRSAINCSPKEALEALSAGANPDVLTWPRGWTVLEPAIRGGCLEVVDLLIEHGADVHLIDSFGRSYLHIATWPGTERTAQIVASLLRAGADPNVILCQTGRLRQITALDNARLLRNVVSRKVSDATVAVLVSHGAKSAKDGEVQADCSDPRQDKPN